MLVVRCLKQEFSFTRGNYAALMAFYRGGHYDILASLVLVGVEVSG
ncbi:MAG: hypothetical protein QXU11_05120 [Thermoproteota archaeon]